MKKRVIKDYRKLPEDIRDEIKEKYPQGFVNRMITFFDKDKQLISALPYDTEDISYLIKMPSSLNLDKKEEGESISDPIQGLVLETSIENLDEEKFLIQEEEEEESD